MHAKWKKIKKENAFLLFYGRDIFQKYRGLIHPLIFTHHTANVQYIFFLNFKAIMAVLLFPATFLPFQNVMLMERKKQTRENDNNKKQKSGTRNCFGRCRIDRNDHMVGLLLCTLVKRPAVVFTTFDWTVRFFYIHLSFVFLKEKMAHHMPISPFNFRPLAKKK